MQLEFAFLSNLAAFLDDGRMVIFGADIDGLEAPGFPTLAAQLCMVAKFWVFPEESVEGHTVALELTHPDGERTRIGDTQPLRAIRNRRDATRPSSAQAAVTLIMTFEAEGTYQFHLIADGNEVKAVPFYVALVPREEEHHEPTANG